MIQHSAVPRTVLDSAIKPILNSTRTLRISAIHYDLVCKLQKAMEEVESFSVMNTTRLHHCCSNEPSRYIAPMDKSSTCKCRYTNVSQTNYISDCFPLIFVGSVIHISRGKKLHCQEKYMYNSMHTCVSCICIIEHLQNDTCICRNKKVLPLCILPLIHHNYHRNERTTHYRVLESSVCVWQCVLHVWEGLSRVDE